MGLTRHLRMAACDIEEMTVDSLKFAFASSDMRHVDQHFGSAKAFAIYAVDPRHATLLEVAQFEEHAKDGNEDKLIAKLEILEGCAAVYCQAVGASAIRQLVARGIQPLKVSEGAAISDLVEALQEELGDTPSSWLAKAIKRQRPASAEQERFDNMEAEGWRE